MFAPIQPHPLPRLVSLPVFPSLLLTCDGGEGWPMVSSDVGSGRTPASSKT